MSYHFNVRLHRMPADALTPVGAYLKLRDCFPDALLLESSDFNNKEQHYSYICCEPVAGIRWHRGSLTCHYPDGSSECSSPPASEVRERCSGFIRSFSFADGGQECCKGRFFGHFNYDAVTSFEQIELSGSNKLQDIPAIQLQAYRYMLVFDHFNHSLYLVSLSYGEEDYGPDKLFAALRRPATAGFPFSTTDEETADCTADEYLSMVEKGIAHCHKGDVFQVVLSRAFSRPFRGDDFNVYRALRMVNPSPYLFYFDYGSYRLFGSSPETQLKVSKGVAVIHPIAGTCRRSGNPEEDEARIDALKLDPKENAEHTMLVDLARNDLSRSHTTVELSEYKAIQQLAHVAHIVSEVRASGAAHNDAVRLIAETFPAGTLSGAPKYKAMQLIDSYEHSARGYYGGSVGFLAPDGDLNQAIMIRSFLSCNHTLHYRAGAGIVASSVPEKELQEIADKLRGLRKAIALAADIAHCNPVLPGLAQKEQL